MSTFVKKIQSALCDMSNISKFNNKYNFLLTCGPELGISRVLEESFRKRVCKRLQMDKGKEYLNQHVRKLLTKYNIELR